MQITSEVYTRSIKLMKLIMSKQKSSFSQNSKKRKDKNENNMYTVNVGGRSEAKLGSLIANHGDKY